MFPEKYLREQESIRKKSILIRNSVTALLFLAGFLLLGSLIHELGHLVALEFKNCSYLFDIGFKITNGIHAEVNPLCVAKPGFLLFFYSIGYLSTLLIGVVLNIAGSVLSHRPRSPYLTALGTGMLLSTILTIGVEGDIQNALSVTGLSPDYSIWISVFVILGVFGASIHGIENLLGLERQE